MQGQLLSLYLTNNKVGCGWRNYLVVEITPRSKQAKLICTDNALPITVPAAELAGGKVLDFRPRRLAKSLKHTALTYHREDSYALKKAIKVLAAMPAKGCAQQVAK